MNEGTVKEEGSGTDQCSFQDENTVKLIKRHKKNRMQASGSLFSLYGITYLVVVAAAAALLMLLVHSIEIALFSILI